MTVKAAVNLEGSPAAILLRVQQVTGSRTVPGVEQVPVEECDPSSPPFVRGGEEYDTDDADDRYRVVYRERKGLGERAVLRLKAMQRRATEGVAKRITSRRLVGWAAVTMVVAGAGMIGIGVKNRLADRNAAAIDGLDDERFSETVVPGANYVRLPSPDIPRPSGEMATLSLPSDVYGPGMIQSAAFHTSSPTSPRGAWLEGTIEDESDFAESVSHDHVGPRLR